MSNPKLPVRFLAFLACLVALAIAVSCRNKLGPEGGDDSPITITGGSLDVDSASGFDNSSTNASLVVKSGRRRARTLEVNGWFYPFPAGKRWELSIQPHTVVVHPGGNSQDDNNMIILEARTGQFEGNDAYQRKHSDPKPITNVRFQLWDGNNPTDVLLPCGPNDKCTKMKIHYCSDSPCP